MNFMKSVIFIVILSIGFAFCAAISSCPSDWSAFNGSCFKFYEMNTNWIKARISCWQLGAGADLASVHSAEENKFLKSLVQNQNFSSEALPGFWLGLLFSRSPGETASKTFWSDDSPVDYANPDTLTPTERGPWYDGPLGRKPDNAGKYDSCTIMGGNREWFDINGVSISSGFFCRKNPSEIANQSPVYVPKNGMSSFLWLAPLFSAFSIVLQLYVVWLVLKKSPESMRDYRFFLCANAASDMGVTIVIGFLMMPDNWMPDAIGGTVYGLGRYFGERGGEITLNLAIFAVACQVGFQLFALFYRFTSVMAREWPKLHQKTSLKITRIFMFVFVMVTSCAVAYIGKDASCNPMETIEQLAPLDGIVHKAFTDAYLAKLPVILLNYLNVLNIMFAFIGAFVLIEFQCVLISVLIIRYLRANAHYFSAHTYKLQLQLIVSILIQLALPLVFVGIPALYVLAFSVLGAQKKGENIFYTDSRPARPASSWVSSSLNSTLSSIHSRLRCL